VEAQQHRAYGVDNGPYGVDGIEVMEMTAGGCWTYITLKDQKIIYVDTLKMLGSKHLMLRSKANLFLALLDIPENYH
jgi:hypothetical protein